MAGRDFTQQDSEKAPQVSVVNQALAKKFFPNENLIGKRFSMDDSATKDRSWLEIEGVVKDTRYAHLRKEPPPLHFDLYRQAKEVGGATYLVRTKMKDSEIAPSLRAAVQRIDRDLPLVNMRTQQQQIDATTQQERTLAIY